MEQFDVLVIGGGPGGYSCAIKAARASLRVAIFEKNEFGGTCLNVGCVPTKYLLDKAYDLEKIRKLTRSGIYKNAGLFNFKEIQRQKALVVEKLTTGVLGLLSKLKVTVVRGEAILRSGKIVECNGKQYSGKNIVIATGSSSATLNIPGAEHAIDSTRLLNIPDIPKTLTIIGGGVIGLEFASLFNSFGSNVTVIEMTDRLLPLEQPQPVAILKKALEKSGITIHLAAKVEKVEKIAARYKTTVIKDGKTISLDSDVVMMSVGRTPNIDCIDAGVGVTFTDTNHVFVDEFCQTNIKDVYAIGDVIGGHQLAHAAYAEAEAVGDAIINKERRVPYDRADIPRCVYTNPTFAAVGKTSTQAAGDALVGSFSYAANGMALAEEAEGSVYVVMSKDQQKTLGVHIVGNHAHELISLATAAVTNQFTLNDWKHMVVAHPSLSEMIREAALDAFKSAIHKI